MLKIQYCVRRSQTLIFNRVQLQNLGDHHPGVLGSKAGKKRSDRGELPGPTARNPTSGGFQKGEMQRLGHRGHPTGDTKAGLEAPRQAEEDPSEP